MIKKNKVILTTIISFTLVSVGTIGFSTWITGIIQTEDKAEGIGVNVDTSENQTAYLNVSEKSDEVINIVETMVDNTADGIKFSQSDDLENDFDIEFNSFQVVLPSTNTFTNYDSVSFTYKLDNGNLPTYSFQGTGTNILNRVTTYTYIEPVVSKIKLSDENYFELDTSVSGYNIYKLRGNMISFKWGSLFQISGSEKITSPVEFYQNAIDSVSKTSEDAKLKEKLNIMNEANIELNAMHEAFYSETSPKKINVTVTLTKSV